MRPLRPCSNRPFRAMCACVCVCAICALKPLLSRATSASSPCSVAHSRLSRFVARRRLLARARASCSTLGACSCLRAFVFARASFRPDCGAPTRLMRARALNVDAINNNNIDRNRSCTKVDAAMTKISYARMHNNMAAAAADLAALFADNDVRGQVCNFIAVSLSCFHVSMCVRERERQTDRERKKQEHCCSACVYVSFFRWSQLQKRAPRRKSQLAHTSDCRETKSAHSLRSLACEQRAMAAIAVDAAAAALAALAAANAAAANATCERARDNSDARTRKASEFSRKNRRRSAKSKKDLAERVAATCACVCAARQTHTHTHARVCRAAAAPISIMRKVNMHTRVRRTALSGRWQGEPRAPTCSSRDLLQACDMELPHTHRLVCDLSLKR